MVHTITYFCLRLMAKVPASDIPSGLPESVILQRNLIHDRASKAATHRIGAWLHDCETAHEMCPGTDLPYLPTRVLDVRPSNSSIEIRLAKGDGLKAAYLTLSHCWGKAISGVDSM